MTTQEREAMILEAVRRVPAVRAGLKLPPGLSADDVDSAAALAVTRAADQFDPARGVPWLAFASQKARWAIQEEIRGHAAQWANGPKSDLVQYDDDGGEKLPADVRASDPAELAGVRETLARRGTRISRLGDTLPSPDVVADKVTRLRAAMYAHISEDDVSEMMRAIMDKAKAGNNGAAKLIMEMLSPSRGGTKVIQQAVFMNVEDVS